MADESAGTGLAELDRALGGLYWGPGTEQMGCYGSSAAIIASPAKRP